MIKIERYTGNKTYMHPNGTIADRTTMLNQFPAILTFTHIIETDEGGQVAFAVQNLSAMRSMYAIDSALTEDEAIRAIEDIRNAPTPEPEPSAEERIAAAMEFQNAMIL